jgi:hypothetical protein
MEHHGLLELALLVFGLVVLYLTSLSAPKTINGMTLRRVRKIARDVAILNMQTNGRSKWNREDYEVCVAEENRLWWDAESH